MFKKYESKDGLEEFEWSGPGLYVTWAEPQRKGGFGSVTRMWQTIEDYNLNGIQGSHGGTPRIYLDPPQDLVTSQ